MIGYEQPPVSYVSRVTLLSLFCHCTHLMIKAHTDV